MRGVYSALGSPMPSLPEIGCRSASRTRLRTAYETARTPGLPASEKIAAPVHPRSPQIWPEDQTTLNLAESRELESHTSRCHRVSKPCRRACPVDSPWRKAAVPIRSAGAPSPFPTGAGHLAGSLSGLAEGGSTRSPCLAGTIGVQSRAGRPDRFTLQDWPPRQDSNLHPSPSEGGAHPVELRGVIARSRRPNRDSRASFRAGSPAGTRASPRADPVGSARPAI